jgi:hypothetical protein
MQGLLFIKNLNLHIRISTSINSSFMSLFLSKYSQHDFINTGYFQTQLLLKFVVSYSVSETMLLIKPYKRNVGNVFKFYNTYTSVKIPRRPWIAYRFSEVKYRNSLIASKQTRPAFIIIFFFLVLNYRLYAIRSYTKSRVLEELKIYSFIKCV